MKHLYYYCLLGVAFCFFKCIPVALAQQQLTTHYNPDNVVPKSPTVAAMTRYGDYPVDLCNGLVNISIPIYTIRTRQLEYPITISYHSSGIKVNEIASEVGLGWALNAHDFISVDVKGHDHSIQSFYTEAQIDSILNSQTELSELRGYFDGSISSSDSQADMYYFKAGDASGHFTYNGNCELVQIPLSDIRIERNHNNNVKQYTITTTDGTIYEYGGNAATSQTINAYGPNIPTAYLLTKIVSADRTDSIRFVYRDVPTFYICTPVFEATRETDLMMTAGGSVYSNLHHYMVTSYHDRVIESIIFEGGRVDFSYDDNRDDLGKLRIRECKAYHEEEGNFHLFMTCSFQHSYFISDDCDNKRSVYPKYFKRLKLDGLKFHYGNDSQDQAYRFGYIDTPLPCYDYNDNSPSTVIGKNFNDNYAQDYWGYYNGKKNNKHLIPRPTNFSNAEFLQFVGNNGGIPDFTPNANFSKACMLSQICYPTGGFTTFQFEPNDSCAGQRIKSISSFDRDATLLEKRSFDYSAPFDISDRDYKANSSYYTREVYTRSYNGISADIVSKQYTYLTSSPTIQHVIAAAPVYYREVTENIGDSSGICARKVYRYDWVQNYSIPRGRPNGICHYRYNMKDNFWKRGHLIQMSIFDVNNGTPTLLCQENYQYSICQLRTEATGLVVTNDLDDQYIGTKVSIDRGYISTHYDWFNTYTDTGYLLLTGKARTDVFGNDSVTTRETYQYDRIQQSSGHSQITSKIIASVEDSQTTRFIYPQDLSLPANNTNREALVAKKFRAANILSVPWEYLVSTRQGSHPEVLTDGTLLHYEAINRISEVYRLHPSLSSTYQGTSLMQDGRLRINEDYTLVASYQRDNYNNIIQTVGTDSIKYAYLWGYKGRYPVIEAKNISYTSLYNNLTGNATTVPNHLGINDTLLHQVRMQHGNVLMDGFDYKPMVGMTSHSSSNGFKKQFGYDSAGRLIQTKENGQTTMEVEYSIDNTATSTSSFSSTSLE